MKNEHTIKLGQTYCGKLPESVGFPNGGSSSPNPETYYSQCGITGAILQTSEGVQRIVNLNELGYTIELKSTDIPDFDALMYRDYYLRKL